MSQVRVAMFSACKRMSRHVVHYLPYRSTHDPLLAVLLFASGSNRKSMSTCYHFPITYSFWWGRYPTGRCLKADYHHTHHRDTHPVRRQAVTRCLSMTACAWGLAVRWLTEPKSLVRSSIFLVSRSDYICAPVPIAYSWIRKMANNSIVFRNF